MKIQKQFTEIITLIKEARYETFKTVNQHLINLYWNIGEYINRSAIGGIHPKARARTKRIF